MKFIELTIQGTASKILCNIENIETCIKSGDECIVTLTGYEDNYFKATESYEEIKKKLEENHYVL